MLSLLILLPLAGGAMAWFFPSNRLRPRILPLFAFIHFALTLALLVERPAGSANGWLVLDSLGAIVLVSISILFLACSIYAVGYLDYRQERSNRSLTMGFLVCLSAMSLVTVSHHLGLLWVALETTTLSMAPLIYFNRNARSIEATWKYMLICSVGIALALLGLFFLAYATMVNGGEATLLLDPLLASAATLSPAWLKAAFVFLLVGFGTKMGLAPLHTWKPDAYGEAPGIVGTILAGGLVNCSFLAIMRVYQISIASTEALYFRHALLALGLISMAVAAIFVMRQVDFKRMLAYSSVEHVGILAIGLGIGGGALFGALFHLINNGLTKGVLFLSSGNIHRSYNSKSREVVSGAMRRLPLSGGLFLAGFFAITGSPPFAPFLSEFTIVRATLVGGNYLTATAMLLFMATIFIGMAGTVLPVVSGDPPANAEETGYRDRFLTIFPPLALLLVVLLLGLWMPPLLGDTLRQAAALLEASP